MLFFFVFLCEGFVCDLVVRFCKIIFCEGFLFCLLFFIRFFFFYKFIKVGNDENKIIKKNLYIFYK